MTPTVLAAHERSKRFHAAIARKATELARAKAPPSPPLPKLSDALLRPIKRRDYATPSRVSAPPLIGSKILRVVAQEFDFTVDDLTSPSRSPKHCIPRYIAIGIFLEMTRMSFGWIGKQLGGRDHSTIFQAQPKVKELLDQEAIRNRVDQMKAEILQ
jgi:hypothetical protein